MARNPATRTDQAANALLAWLEERGVTRPLRPAVTAEHGDEQAGQEGGEMGRVGGSAASRHDATRFDPEERRSALAPTQTDWLFHHLCIDGPETQIAAFRIAAAGAGVIPWHLDLDRMEEDAFLRLVAPPAGQARTLSLDGARMLAVELRDAVARRHALAVARVGRSRACCFDLHSLMPVPGEVLRLGPDHPDALLWLWTHWGTTDALRQVTLAPATAAPPFRVSFWSADWTPWRALAAIEARWPALRFEVKPRYELA